MCISIERVGDVYSVEEFPVKGAGRSLRFLTGVEGKSSGYVKEPVVVSGAGCLAH